MALHHADQQWLLGTHRAGAFLVLVALVGSLLLPSNGSPQGVPSLQRYDLLLPPRGSSPVQYLLQGENGCFTWEWDRHDLISVELVRNNSAPSSSWGAQQCASSALISSTAPISPTPMKAVIRATDSATGDLLVCTVNIDVITRLKIHHQSHALGLHSVATLEVKAYNSKDDIFATVSGLEFDWDLSPVDPRSSQHHLVNVPFEDARVAQEEDSKLRNAADVVMVRGVHAGQENVSVVLQEWVDFYSSPAGAGQAQDLGVPVPSHWIVLTVAEEFSVEPPSPIVLLVGSSLKLKLRTTVGRKPKGNPGTVSVGGTTGVLSAREEGSAIITVNDTRSPGHQQSCSVKAVLRPSLVKLLLVWITEDASEGAVVSGAGPLDSTTVSTFHMVAGREYAIIARAYHSSYMATPIIVSQAEMCTLSLEERHGYWEPVQGSAAKKAAVLSALLDGSGGQFQADSTLGFVTARKEGKGKVSTSVGRNVGAQTKAHASVAVQVCTPVSMETLPSTEACFSATTGPGAPPLMRLPWLPGRAETVRLIARGGCGEGPEDYRWSTNDSSVATVSPSGQLTTAGPGAALIRIAASVDSTNFLELHVQVRVPHSLVAVTDFVSGGEDTAVEVPVGEVLRLAADFVSRDGQRFTCCQSLAPLVSWHVAHPASSIQQAFHMESPSITSSSGTPTKSGATGRQAHTQGKSTPGTPSAHPSAAPSRCHCSQAVILAEAPGRAEIRAEAHLPALDEEARDARGAGGPGGPGMALAWSAAAYGPLTLLQVQDGRGHGGYGFRASGDRTLCVPEGRPRDGLPCHGRVSGSGSGSGSGEGASGTEGTGDSGGQRRDSAESLCFTVLAPGAALLVKAEGGPEQWLPGRDFVKSVEVFSVATARGGAPKALPGSAEVLGSGAFLVPDGTHGAAAGGLAAHPQGLSDGRLFELRCTNPGHYAVKFTRGHLTPTKSQGDLPAVVLGITCTLPSAVVLLVDDTESFPESIEVAREASLSVSAGKASRTCSSGTGAGTCAAPAATAKGKAHRVVAVPNGRQLGIAAVALDVAGVPFANASSVGLSWSLRGCEDLAAWYPSSAPPQGAPSWERFLDVLMGEGECFISAKVVPPSGSEAPEPVRDLVLLQVVRALSIRPPLMLLLNHPDATVRFVLSGGTENVQASLSNMTVARILPVVGAASHKHVHVSSLAPGEASLTATDEGLHHHRTATATVVVADVAWIRVLSEDDLVGPSGASSTRQLASGSRTYSPSQAGSGRGGAVEVLVEVGHTVCIPFLAGDDAGNVFPRSQVEVAGLQDLASVTVDYEGTCGAPKNSASTPGAAPGGAPSEAALGVSGDAGDTPGVPCFVRLHGLRVGATSDVQVDILPLCLQLSAFHSSGNRVSSPLVTVRVFPPLQLSPQALVLAPGALFALGTAGGPSAGAGFSSLRFSSSNESAAAVDPETGLVTAVAEGVAVVRAVVETQGPWDRLSNSAEAQVTVRIPEAVALRVQSLELAVGHTTAAFPTELLKGAEGLSADALSFASLCFDFAWAVADPEVLELATVATDPSRAGNKGSQGAPGSYSSGASRNGLAAFVTAGAPGTSKLSLSFECSFPRPSPRVPPVRRQYSASASLTVLSWPRPKGEGGTPGGCPVWVLPLEHTTSSPLWSPAPKPQRKGAPKPHLTYSLLTFPPTRNGTGTMAGTGAGAGVGSPQISLLEGGRVRTHATPALACICAWDENAKGLARDFQDVVGCVRSAEIGQLALLAPGKASRYAVELSLGAEHTLNAAFSNAFGIPFHEVALATRDTLRWETNRRDVVGVELTDGLSLSIKALKEGTAAVRVWSTSDGCGRGSSSSAWSSTSTPVHAWSCTIFIQVTVRGVLILPSSPTLLAGSTLTLELGQASGKKQPAGAAWASSNPSVVEITDHQRGGIKAMRSGKAIVTFTSPAVSAQTTVTVISAEAVELSGPRGTPLLSNHPPLYTSQEGYAFPLTIKDEQGRDVSRQDLAAPFPFRCTVVPPFAGDVAAALHSPSEGPTCIFRPFSPQQAYQAAKQQQQQQQGASAGIDTGSSSGSGSGSTASGASGLSGSGTPLSSHGGTEGALGTGELGSAESAPGAPQQDLGRPGAHRRLTVSALVEGGPEGQALQGSVEVDFVGGFQISGAQRKQVVLTQDVNETTVTLFGNIGNLAVSWARRDVLRVAKLRTRVVSPLLAEGAEYIISVAGPASAFQDRLTFTLPATGQQESLLVSYKQPPAGIPLGPIISSALPYLILGLVSLLLLYLISYICASLRSAPAPLPPVQLNVAPFTPMGARYANGTPAGSYHSPFRTPAASASRQADVGIQNYTPGMFHGGTPPIDSSY